jgi:hypothetical protein
LHESPLQVVRVGGPHCLDMYGEYFGLIMRIRYFE